MSTSYAIITTEIQSGPDLIIPATKRLGPGDYVPTPFRPYQGTSARTAQGVKPIAATLTRVFGAPCSAPSVVPTGQRPKNNHNRMITGIGTPSSQSRSPRPIVASMKTLSIQKNAKRDVGFRRKLFQILACHRKPARWGSSSGSFLMSGYEADRF